LNGSKKKPEVEVYWRGEATGTYGASQITDLRAFQPSSPIASAAMNHVTTNFAGGMPSATQMGAEVGFAETSSSMPAVIRTSPNRGAPASLGASSSPQAKSMLDKGTDFYDIPAFLRKQAD
jgi:cell division protein FtsZ